MILVYTNKITPRINYVFRHIFNNILQSDFKFTTKIEEFIAFNGTKFSYSNQALGNEFHITPHPILFQQGIKKQSLDIGFWNEIPTFFRVENSDIPFDLFSASFYLLSRYEEYIESIKDEHERYNHRNSILSKQDVIDRPIIEIWIDVFKQKILEKFPQQTFIKRKFYFEPLINVSMARLYKNKSFLRHMIGSIYDFFRFKFKFFWLRQIVYFGNKKDPYDTFGTILKLKKKYNHNLSFFHLLNTYSQFDHNVSPNKKNYQNQIKYLSDYADTGILTSYYSMNYEKTIVNEVKRLENIIHKPVEKAKAHFNRINIPKTYQFFIETEIKKDYSMGYNKKIGFRAGTSIPFFFYDIENETQTNLLIHPTVISDIMLRYKYNLQPNKALHILIEQGELIKKYGGNFHPVFHNFILSDLKFWKKWNDVYIETIKHFSK